MEGLGQLDAGDAAKRGINDALRPKSRIRPLKDMRTLKGSQFRRKDEEYSLTHGEIEIMV